MLTISRPTSHRLATPHAQRRLARHSFGWEANLVDVLCAQAGEFALGKGHCEVQTEWAVSNRIADVALYTFSACPRIEPRIKALVRLTMIELSVLAGTVAAPCATAQLASRLYLCEDVVGRALTKLKRLDLVESTSYSTTDLVRATDWISALPTSLHLIEAKLEDWEQAISQAANYRRFADAASVALPLSFAERLDVYAACEARGVGLILLRADGEGFQAVAPAESEPKWRAIRLQSYMELLRHFVLKNVHASSLHTGIEH